MRLVSALGFFPLKQTSLYLDLYSLRIFQAIIISLSFPLLLGSPVFKAGHVKLRKLLPLSQMVFVSTLRTLSVEYIIFQTSSCFLYLRTPFLLSSGFSLSLICCFSSDHRNLKRCLCFYTKAYFKVIRC